MSGEERFLHAVHLSKLVRELAMTSIKNDFPQISQRDLVSKYIKRLSITRHGRNRNSTKGSQKTRNSGFID